MLCLLLGHFAVVQPLSMAQFKAYLWLKETAVVDAYCLFWSLWGLCSSHVFHRVPCCSFSFGVPDEAFSFLSIIHHCCSAPETPAVTAAVLSAVPPSVQPGHLYDALWWICASLWPVHSLTSRPVCTLHPTCSSVLSVRIYYIYMDVFIYTPCIIMYIQRVCIYNVCILCILLSALLLFKVEVLIN